MPGQKLAAKQVVAKLRQIEGNRKTLVERTPVALVLLDLGLKAAEKAQRTVPGQITLFFGSGL